MSFARKAVDMDRLVAAMTEVRWAKELDKLQPTFLMTNQNSETPVEAKAGRMPKIG
jgi:hypothetical protein